MNTSHFIGRKNELSLLKDRDLPERLVLIIDEFTYLYHSNPTFDSTLQNAIDRILKDKNILLILCGPHSLCAHYRGNLLFVGINYDENTKQHQCVIEKLEI